MAVLKRGTLIFWVSFSRVPDFWNSHVACSYSGPSIASSNVTLESKYFWEDTKIGLSSGFGIIVSSPATAVASTITVSIVRLFIDELGGAYTKEPPPRVYRGIQKH